MAFCRLFRGQADWHILGVFGLQVSVGVCGRTRSRIQLCRYRHNVPPELRFGVFQNWLQRFAGEHAVLSLK